jgi:hypothetical protein
VHNRGFDIAERRRHLTVAVDRTEMQRRLSVILETSVGDNFAFHPEIDLSNGAGCLLGQLANFIFEGGSNIASLPPSVFANLSDAFFNLALGSLQHSFSDRLHAGGDRVTSPSKKGNRVYARSPARGPYFGANRAGIRGQHACITTRFPTI